MEDKEHLENFLSLGTEFSLMTSSFLESPTVTEGLTTPSVEKQSAQNTTENNQTFSVQASTEVFNSESSSVTSWQPLRRTSLMKLFDPLHSLQQNAKKEDKCYNGADKKEYPVENCEVFPSKKIASKTESNNSHDTLISLESPKKLAKPLIPKNLFSEDIKPVKKYTEEYFCHVLKAQELRLREEFSQRYSEQEMYFTEKNQILDRELCRLVSVNKSNSLILSEILTILENTKMKNKQMVAKLKDLNVENEKLKEDIKMSKEDLCNLESAFSDVYKWYETSKRMIKSHKENEERLQKNIETTVVALNEQKSMNEMLDSRTQDVVDKAAKEIENAKKNSETQIMILEAQRKKVEIKIDSLENDLQQARLSSDELGSIYDDLVAKFKT